MFQLRPYQELLIEGIRDEFRQGRRHSCIVAPCGAGKTIIMAWMAAQSAVRGQSVLFAVHRQELIDQSSQTFATLGIHHGIIASGCPANDELIQIGSIFTVARRMAKIQEPGVLIFDECFVAGTMIGDKPIEQLKVGDMVPCFDGETNQVNYSNITHVFKRPAPAMLLHINISGQSVTCTPDHPVYTPEGWKSAKEIKEGDKVYVCMSTLRRRDEGQKGTKMLGVLSERHDREKPSGSSGENDNQEPDAKPGNQEKNVHYPQADEAQATGKGWERNRKHSPSSDFSACNKVDEPGICPQNRAPADAGRISNALQNRHRKPGPENSDRDRWIFPYCSGQKTAGQEEREFLNVARVDSIEVFKQGCSDEFEHLCPDGYVYNIEVAKFNTYFANGLAVHNCHHAVANTWRKLMQAFPKAFIIGLTATPARMGGEGLGDIFESLVLGPSVSQLIDWGNLSPYQYYAPPVRANLDGLRVKYGEYVRSDVALRMDKSEIIGDAVEQYRKLADGKRAICYCVGRAHSEHTAEMFREAGINAVHIDGETQNGVRKAAIEQFRTGEIQVLCNVDLISEGFDVPAMEAVILLRPTQSLTLHIQQSMRPMRPDSYNHNKTAVIIDHVGNVYRHGLPDEDRTWSLEGKKKKQSEPRETSIRQCPECYAAHRPAPVCPLCGYTYKIESRAEPDQRKGELAKIDELERKRKRQEVGRARSITDLEQIALSRGYSLRWIAKMAEIKKIPSRDVQK